MDGQSVDYVELLKKAEDEAAAVVEKARQEGGRSVKQAHERASAILDDAGRNAAGRKHSMLMDARALSAQEAEAILAKGKGEADAILKTPVDASLAAECLREFLGGLGV
jgi:ATP synthase H subunit